MFFRGQKVVYVGWKKNWRDRINLLIHPCVLPIVGRTYTISNIYQGPKKLLIEVKEIVEPASDYWCPGWNAEHFRPLVDRKTDISALKALLEPASRMEEV